MDHHHASIHEQDPGILKFYILDYCISFPDQREFIPPFALRYCRILKQFVDPNPNPNPS